eukprot:201664-Rhodomonas_salina.1
MTVPLYFNGSLTLMDNLHNGLPAGGIFVIASDLGGAGYTAKIRVGTSDCEQSRWVSETSVKCLAASGLSGTLRVGMTVGVRVSSMSEGATYDGPSKLELSILNRRSTEITSLTVMGSGLGAQTYSGEGRIEGTSCEGSGWASETSVMCRGAGGNQASAKMGITVGVRVGSLTEGMSFDGAS